MTHDEILDSAAGIGRAMLESGAETYRVEDSLSRIINAYDIGRGEVFAIPNYIHINLRGPDGVSHTRMMRASTTKATDMQRLNALNALCRRICDEKPSADEIRTSISDIAALPNYGLPAQMLATALGSGGFSAFFGGSIADALCAAFCGLVLGALLFYMGGRDTNLFFKSIVGSALTALIAVAETRLGFGRNLDMIIIGTLMCLVPGIMITNFMRDIIAGDWVAGVTKLTEALLIAAGIALGAGIVLYAAQAL
jgi:uncharacterized membrane protein YjjP (DUF1212 family)